MERVLIGGPVYQKPDILSLYLRSLARLAHGGFGVDFLFIDDNQDAASSDALRAFAPEGAGVTVIPGEEAGGLAYHCDEEEHHWRRSLTLKVARYKDDIFRRALDGGYAHVFLVDSDLILHPKLLEHLRAAEKDILSEIFWTRWRPDHMEMPNVWLFDIYDLVPRAFWEELTPQEETARQLQFLATLRVPGAYRVGGLGACTLISRKALAAGVSFEPVENLTFVGEDRHFCVRASVLGLDLLVDTHYPAFHIYRESDLWGGARYLQETEEA